MQSTEARSAIVIIRSVFANFGLSEQIVSDNGTAFVTEELAEFLCWNGFRHLRSAPHHPQTNGEAKRFVGTFMLTVIIGCPRGAVELEIRLQQFLLKYRTTSHSIIGRPFK